MIHISFAASMDCRKTDRPLGKRPNSATNAKAMIPIASVISTRLKPDSADCGGRTTRGKLGVRWIQRIYTAFWGRCQRIVAKYSKTNGGDAARTGADEGQFFACQRLERGRRRRQAARHTLNLEVGRLVLESFCTANQAPIGGMIGMPVGTPGLT